MIADAVFCLFLLINIGEESLITENQSNRPLKIAAWNIQVLGTKKMGNDKVVDIIKKVIKRYDMVAVMEIRDSSQKAFPQLIDILNKNNADPYVGVISERLGRSTSKEQYAFIYRSSTFKVISKYQYPSRYNKFERPPFALRFLSPHTILDDFTIILVHTAPKEAYEEIIYMKHINKLVSKKWKTKDTIIMGDLNADCSYVSKKKMKTLRRTFKLFTWFIGDAVDTTTSNTDCAYDRILTKSAKVIENIVKGSVKVFRFDTEYSLNYTEAKSVSDHYPVEFALRTYS